MQAVDPWAVHAPRDPEIFFKEKVTDQVAIKSDAPRLRRRIYVKQAGVEACGYMVKCSRCDNNKRYGLGRTTKQFDLSDLLPNRTN